MSIAYVAPRTIERFRRQCKGKIRHGTEESARQHSLCLKKVKPFEAFGHYECGFCGHYHVGHDRRSPPPVRHNE